MQACSLPRKAGTTEVCGYTGVSEIVCLSLRSRDAAEGSAMLGATVVKGG